MTQQVAGVADSTERTEPNVRPVGNETKTDKKAD